MQTNKPSHNNKAPHRTKGQQQKAQVFLQKTKSKILQDFRNNKDFWYYCICGGLIITSLAYVIFSGGSDTRRFYGNIKQRESVFDAQDRTVRQNPSCPLIWERFGDFNCPLRIKTAQDFEKCFTVPITKRNAARNFLIRKYMQDNTNKPEIRYITPDTEGTYINASPGHSLRVFVLKAARGSLAADSDGVLYVQRDPCNISSRTR